MTVTIWGVVADAVGSVVHKVLGLNPYGQVELRHNCYSMPASSYARVQPAHIELDIDHRDVVGRVRYLERDEQGRLHAVCEAGDEAVRAWADRPPRFSSATRSRRDYTEATMHSLALTDDPASVALPGVQWAPGPLDDIHVDKLRARHTPGHQLLQRAVNHLRHDHRTANDTMLIVERRSRPNITHLANGMTLDPDGNPLPVSEGRHATYRNEAHDDDYERPVGSPIEIRPGGRILSVGGRRVR